MEIFYILTLFIPTLASIFFALANTYNLQNLLVYTIAAALTYPLTLNMINSMKPLFLKNDIYGMDINKRGTPGGEIKIPESAGLISSSLFIVFNMLSIGFIAYSLPQLS